MYISMGRKDWVLKKNLVLVVFQGVVPFDEIKKGECIGEGVLQKPLSHLLCISRDLICLNINDI